MDRICEINLAKLRGGRLKRIRNLGNLSRKQLCASTGINFHTLKGWETGRFGGLSASGAKRIIEYLKGMGVNCSFDWLMNNMGPGPISIADYSPCNGHSFNEPLLLNHADLIQQEIKGFNEIHPETLALHIVDDSMSPFFHLDDYVLGIKQPLMILNTLIGKDCLVEIKKGVVVLRTLRQRTHAKGYDLVCHNTTYRENNAILLDVKIINIAPVVWHRRSLPL